MSFRQVDPIPRGRPHPNPHMPSMFLGGAPRCPVCLKSCAQFNAYRMRLKHGAGFGFNCPRCRVWWLDTRLVLCYVCEQPFEHDFSDALSSCYHLNTVHRPCCPSCSPLVQNRLSVRRRSLRRLISRVISCANHPSHPPLL